MNWRCDSSDRDPALQVQTPVPQKKKKKKRILFVSLLAPGKQLVLTSFFFSKLMNQRSQDPIAGGGRDRVGL
jgi:hypothetical protein